MTEQTPVRWYAVMEGGYEYVREVITDAEYVNKYYKLPVIYRPRCVLFDTQADALAWAARHDDRAVEEYSNYDHR